jgi:hypothetical protein
MRTPGISCPSFKSSVYSTAAPLRAAAEPARLLVNGAVLRMEQAERRVTVVDHEVVAIEV